ncbi:MAG: fumarylpyruvate hydrolase [Candidatus Azotimanducaceae bacterium]|jgi:fumarylpyruvate hydrolase
MSFVIEPSPQVTIPVSGSELDFPVNNIYCVGRNYAEHTIEMGGDPNREAPFFFMKPAYAISTNGVDMAYPDHSSDVHHEVELVVALASGGVNVTVAEAMALVFGYGVGVDMTRRDLQAEAKEKRRPWEAGKTFFQAAPCSDLASIAKTGELNNGAISLSINGESRQQGDVNQMIWKVAEVISRLSELFFLQPGDLIYTGTPAGVGPIEKGDDIIAKVEGLPELSFQVS